MKRLFGLRLESKIAFLALFIVYRFHLPIVVLFDMFIEMSLQHILQLTPINITFNIQITMLASMSFQLSFTIISPKTMVTHQAHYVILLMISCNMLIQIRLINKLKTTSIDRTFNISLITVFINMLIQCFSCFLSNFADCASEFYFFILMVLFDVVVEVGRHQELKITVLEWAFYIFFFVVAFLVIGDLLSIHVRLVADFANQIDFFFYFVIIF